jgi:NADH:ubiquinone oxidoreductase subunit 2 (subunit N)
MTILRFEARHERPISRAEFTRRMMRHGGYATLVVVGSLALGVAGYTGLAHQAPIDALLNAAMLLGGMGPVGPIEGTWAKLFAAGFALYAGLIFLVVAGLLLAPVFHRVLHRFHWESEHARSE